MRRWILLLVMVVGVLGAGAMAAHAAQVDDLCTVAADEVVEGNLFVLCQQLVIEGRVTGDVVGVALTAEIDGQIEGGLVLVSGRLNLRGSIGQDVYFAGPVFYLRPDARLLGERSDIYSLSLTTRIDAPVSGAVSGAGYELFISAPVSGDIHFAGTSLTINSTVAGNVNASVGSSTDSTQQLRSVTQWFEAGLTLGHPGLTITEQGVIEGNLTYSSPAIATIDGLVQGALTFNSSDLPAALNPDVGWGERIGSYFEAVLRDYIATLLVGLVVVLLSPRILTPPVQTIYRKVFPSFAVGLFTFVLSFPAFLLASFLGVGLVLLISLLGFPDFTVTAAVVIGALIVASAALFFLTSVLVSRLVVSAAIGRPLLRRFNRAARPRLYMLLSVALGGLITSALSALPVVGILITAVITFFGLGGIVLALQRSRQPEVIAVPVVETRAAPVPAAPLLLVRGPGTDNLPEGFTWWQ